MNKIIETQSNTQEQKPKSAKKKKNNNSKHSKPTSMNPNPPYEQVFRKHITFNKKSSNNRNPVDHRKYKSHRYKSQKSQDPTKPHKREIRCFKCGQKGHIAPNCRKQKITVLSDSKEDCYSEKNTSSSSEFDNSQNKNPLSEKEQNQTDKIENCLCQVNVLTTDQELLTE